MIAQTGYAAMAVAFVFCLYSVAAGWLGARRRRADLIESAERSVLAVVFLIIFATGLLVHSLVTHNFSIEYVAHYTSSTLSPGYCITALWGGQAGSLLFWVLVLSLFTLVVVLQNQNRNRQLMPYVTSLLMGIVGFFLTALLFAANPFKTISPVPLDGQDSTRCCKTTGWLRILLFFMAAT